jgi:hypothetical protein
MLLIIFVIIIVVAIVYGLNSQRRLNLNERIYLRSRGYEPPVEFDEGPPVSKDIRLLGLIESLSDISPYARQRAAEDLSRMCASGKRDQRMLPALVAALDDNDASVRAAVAMAVGNLGDPASIGPLKRRLELEESIHVKASLQQTLEKLSE